MTCPSPANPNMQTYWDRGHGPHVKTLGQGSLNHRQSSNWLALTRRIQTSQYTGDTGLRWKLMVLITSLHNKGRDHVRWDGRHTSGQPYITRQCAYWGRIGTYHQLKLCRLIWHPDLPLTYIQIGLFTQYYHGCQTDNSFNPHLSLQTYYCPCIMLTGPPHYL